MLFRVMPRQKIYFDSFERCARAGGQAAGVLLKMLQAGEGYAAFSEEIAALEAEGDRATFEVVSTLKNKLATPFDRSDIRALIEALDDTLDVIDTVGHRLVLYRAGKARPEAIELAGILARMMPLLENAVAALPSAKTTDAVLLPCRELHVLESEADKVLRRGIGALFDELKDPIELIKWKELLELLEQATDTCEDAAKILEEIVGNRA